MDRRHVDTAIPRKSVSDRYFDLYQEEKVNGLHLVAFWYGDGDETGDSDTFMQSTTNNRHGQLFTLEHSSGEMLQETIDSCTWSKQYPEGYFAHLQSELPDIRVISGIRERVQIFAPGGKRLQLGKSGDETSFSSTMTSSPRRCLFWLGEKEGGGD